MCVSLFVCMRVSECVCACVFAIFLFFVVVVLVFVLCLCLCLMGAHKTVVLRLCGVPICGYVKPGTGKHVCVRLCAILCVCVYLYL